MENEVKTWVPITSNNFAGTVMRYGDWIQLQPTADLPLPTDGFTVFEVVGWSVLDVHSPTELESFKAPPVTRSSMLKPGCDSTVATSKFMRYGQALTSDACTNSYSDWNFVAGFRPCR